MRGSQASFFNLPSSSSCLLLSSSSFLWYHHRVHPLFSRINNLYDHFCRHHPHPVGQLATWQVSWLAVGTFWLAEGTRLEQEYEVKIKVSPSSFCLLVTGAFCVQEDCATGLLVSAGLTVAGAWYRRRKIQYCSLKTPHLRIVYNNKHHQRRVA